jgi:hypothetical protein
LNKTTVAHYDADKRGIQTIILACCTNSQDHFRYSIIAERNK